MRSSAVFCVAPNHFKDHRCSSGPARVYTMHAFLLTSHSMNQVLRARAYDTVRQGGARFLHGRYGEDMRR